MKTPLQFIVLLCLSGPPANSQDVIQLENPSFEAELADVLGRPAAWRSTDATDRPHRQAGGILTAADGNACLSLLARADSSRQTIGIQLPPKTLLRRDSSYRLTLSLMQARHNENDLACEGPAVLRVWAYHSRLKRRELLLESDPVSNAAWMPLEFLITPVEDSYDELWLEAGYDPQKPKPYNTNLLIDNILPLTKVKDKQEIRRMQRVLPVKQKEVKPQLAVKPLPSEPPAPENPTLPASARTSKVEELLSNPSFEDTQLAVVPPEWSNCGFAGESAPDVQPGSFQVTESPKHGSTYLGMVVRDNETWEAVGQRLRHPLKKDQTYRFAASLMRSKIYMSISQITHEPSNYTTPAKLRIWGGYADCDRKELLAETSLITHTKWLEYEIGLQPKKSDYPFIILEVYYQTPVLHAYNGHVLIDDCTLKQVND